MGNKTIVITGASSGIGKATAIYFHEKGWNVVATMRKPESIIDLPESDNFLKVRLDVQEKESIKSAIKISLEKFGKIDVLLNNAGYGTAGPFEAATDEQIKRQFDVNLFGLMDTIKEVLPAMRSEKDGLIINVSSIGGLITLPLFSLYHSTKWAVEGFTESLQYELNPLGIKVKIVEPGGVKTDFAGRSLDMLDSSNLSDYHPTLNRMLQNFAPDANRDDNYSTSEQIAEIIYGAATDGSNKLRYVAGEDAKQFWTQRQSVSQEDFFNGIKQNMLG